MTVRELIAAACDGVSGLCGSDMYALVLVPASGNGEKVGNRKRKRRNQRDRE